MKEEDKMREFGKRMRERHLAILWNDLQKVRSLFGRGRDRGRPVGKGDKGGEV